MSHRQDWLTWLMGDDNARQRFTRRNPLVGSFVTAAPTSAQRARADRLLAEAAGG